MKLEHILLGVLLEHPSTGYDLKRYMDTHGRFLRSNTQMSQVYRTLTAMESRGWIVHTVEPKPGARDAKRYSVTERGELEFFEWLHSPYQPPSRFQDPDFFVLLSFSGFMTRDAVLALVDTELAARAAQIARYRFRDRSRPIEHHEAFDSELAGSVGEWMHNRGATAMDAHVDALIELRRQLQDPERADMPAPAAVAAHR